MPYETKERTKLLPFDKFVDVESTGKDGRVFKYQLLWDGQRAICNRCGANIGWGLSRNKKFIPFDVSGSGKTHWDTCNGNNDPLG